MLGKIGEGIETGSPYYICGFEVADCPEIEPGTY